MTYYLTEEEDFALRRSILFPGKVHSLYEHLCELPLEDLRAYPKKGYRWWMGRAARTAKGLALQDYILHWRLFSLSFRERYNHAYLDALTTEQLQFFVRAYSSFVPVWAIQETLRDALILLMQRDQDLW